MCLSLALLALPLAADFSYEQTSRITGGTLYNMMRMAGPFARQAREPQKSSVLLKDNRMAHVYADHTEVIDVDAETITRINHKDKTYSVMTFAEMAEAMKQARERMQGQTGEAPKAEVDYKASVKETGQRKQINGLDTVERIMTVEMQVTDPKSGQSGTTTMTSDNWYAEKVPGSEEAKKFYMRMAQKMAWTPGAGAMMGGRPEMARGMANLAKESAKMEGMAVLENIKMTGLMAGMPQTPPEGSRQQSSGQAQQQGAKPSLSDALGGRLGGFGGLGRRKKQEPPKEEAKKEEPKQEEAAPAASSDALMEMTIEHTNFSSASVDSSRLAVPSGYRQVESEMKKFLRKQQ